MEPDECNTNCGSLDGFLVSAKMRLEGLESESDLTLQYPYYKVQEKFYCRANQMKYNRLQNTHTHAHTHARTHARTHAHARARTRTHTHTHTHSYAHAHTQAPTTTIGQHHQDKEIMYVTYKTKLEPKIERRKLERERETARQTDRDTERQRQTDRRTGRERGEQPTARNNCEGGFRSVSLVYVSPSDRINFHWDKLETIQGNCIAAVYSAYILLSTLARKQFGPLR